MATIKIYFDDRRPDIFGRGQLKVVIRNRNTTTSCNLGFALPVGAWDETKQKVISHPDLKERPAVLNAKIQAEFVKVEYAFRQTAGIKSSLTAKELLRRTLITLYGDSSVEGAEKSFEDTWNEFVNAKVAEGSKKKYSVCWAFLLKNDKVATKFIMSQITQEHVERWYKMLLDSVAVNSAATYMGAILAVLHYAEKKKYINWHAELKIKHEATKSRALSIEELRKIWNYLETDEYKSLYPKQAFLAKKAVRAFKFSFACAGLNLADILDITPDDFVKGRLQKSRKKTGMRINILLQPEAISSWKGLREELGNDKRLATESLNNALDKIVPGATMYYARHTWATLANKLGIPNEIIALGLAHKYGGLTNQVYVEKDYELLDAANRKILDYVAEK